MKLNKYWIICSTFLILAISCDDQKNSANRNSGSQNTSVTLFGKKNIVFAKISPEAEMYLNNWTVFSDFTTEAIAINGTDLKNLQTRSELLLSRLDSLTKRIPDTLDTQPIYARILVAKTRAAILHQLSNKTKIDTSLVQESVAEMNTATNNLIVQINEKFQKDGIDRQRTDNEKQELELRKKKADSIFKAELKDKKSKQ